MNTPGVPLCFLTASIQAEVADIRRLFHPVLSDIHDKLDRIAELTAQIDKQDKFTAEGNERPPVQVTEGEKTNA